MCTDNIHNLYRIRILPTGKSKSGFTLAEMIIAVAIGSIIAVTVSLALNQSYKRTIQVRNNIAQAARQDEVFELIKNDLRWAVSISFISDDWIIFDRPKLSGSGNDTVRYHWDSSDKAIHHQINSGDVNIIASDVTNLKFTPDIINKNNTDYIRGIYVDIQWNNDAFSTQKQYITILNEPEKP